MFAWRSLVVCTLVACGGPAPQTPPAPTHEVVPAGLTAEGTRYDPAVEVDAIPEGAWYCDMGTVHYARAGEGDGLCPVCGMKLRHRAGAGH